MNEMIFFLLCTIMPTGYGLFALVEAIRRAVHEPDRPRGHLIFLSALLLLITAALLHLDFY